MAEDQVPAVRNFVAFGLIMATSMAAAAAVGVAIFGAPGLPPETSEHHVPFHQPDEVIEITLSEWTIDAIPATVTRGAVVEFVVVNEGTGAHDFKLFGTSGVSRLEPGNRESFQTGPVQGDIVAWCTILGHRDNGMEITLTVVDPAPTSEDKPPPP